MILSASSVAALSDYGSSWYFFNRQLMWALVGALAFVFAARLDYRRWRKRRARRCSSSRSDCSRRCSSPASGSTSTDRAAGSARVRLRVQPSELAKLALVVACAAILGAPGRHAARRARVAAGARRARGRRLPRDQEPDLDTAIVLALIAFAMLIVGGVPLRPAREDGRFGAPCRHRARVRRALPTRPHVLVPASGLRRREHRLPAQAVADRARQRRCERRRDRRGPRQVAVPPERAHRLHLLDHRRGDSASSGACSCSGCSPASASSASTSRGAPPTSSARCSRRGSPSGSSGRPRSTSARSSECFRSRGSRCRSCRPADRRS